MIDWYCTTHGGGKAVIRGEKASLLKRWIVPSHQQNFGVYEYALSPGDRLRSKKHTIETEDPEPSFGSV